MHDYIPPRQVKKAAWKRERPSPTFMIFGETREERVCVFLFCTLPPIKDTVYMHHAYVPSPYQSSLTTPFCSSHFPSSLYSVGLPGKAPPGSPALTAPQQRCKQLSISLSVGNLKDKHFSLHNIAITSRNPAYKYTRKTDPDPLEK